MNVLDAFYKVPDDTTRRFPEWLKKVSYSILRDKDVYYLQLNTIMMSKYNWIMLPNKTIEKEGETFLEGLIKYVIWSWVRGFMKL